MALWGNTLGLAAGDVVSERQAELLLGEGRHPDTDRIERELLTQGRVRRRPGGRPCSAGYEQRLRAHPAEAAQVLRMEHISLAPARQAAGANRARPCPAGSAEHRQVVVLDERAKLTT